MVHTSAAEKMETPEESSSSYVVLARKWRPATFKDVVGQKHIVQPLQNAIKMNRLAGAYLFSGMRGVGKTSMARIMARSVNCESGPTVTPCGKCENCIEIEKGSSMDVREIDAASNRGIDDAREIRDHLQYAPVKCRSKIYIIDEVHMLTREAFNALLKTLEEPPPHTMFILATTEQNKVPETVLSRCQCFEFRALTEAQITERLSHMAQKENIPVSETGLKMITRRAEGSMRDAQSLLDQLGSYAGENIDDEQVGLTLGLVSREKVWELLDAVIEKDAEKAIKKLQDIYYAGYEVRILIREMFESVRTLTITKVSSAPEMLLEESPDAIKSIKEMAMKVSTGRLQQFYDVLLKTEAQCRSAGNMISVLEMALIKMVRLDDVVPIDEILNRLKGMHGGTAQKTVSYGAPAPSPAVKEQPSAPAGSDTQWPEIKGAILQQKPQLAGTVERVTGLSLENGKASLTFPKGQSLVESQLNKNREIIVSIIEKITGEKYALVLIEDSSAAPIASAEKKKNNITKEARNTMMNDPIIRKAVEMFEGLPGIEENNK